MRNYFYSIVGHVILLLLFLLFPLLREPVDKEVVQHVVSVDFSQRQEPKAEIKPLAASLPVIPKEQRLAKSSAAPKAKSAPSPNTLQTSQKPKAESNKAKAIQEVSTVKAISQPPSPSKEELAAIADKKAHDEKLSSFKSLFSKVKEGSGETLKASPERSSDAAEAKEGTIKALGSEGNIRGQLGSRSVLFTPTIKDDSQKKGRVVVKICVNGEGKVVSADYTQVGSTTSDFYLIKLATDGVKKYLFERSENAKECGRVVVDFQLK